MKHLLLLTIVLTLVGCTKDRLQKETAIFIGDWTWNHSIRYNSSTQDTLYASDFSETFSLTFEEKGKVLYKKNNSEEEKYRIVFSEFKSGLCTMTDCYKYTIKLNNKADNILSGSLNADTLITSDTNLPYSKGSDEYPIYEHVYLKN